RIGKGFSGVETPLFNTILVKPQDTAEVEEDEDNEVSAAPTPPSPTPATTPPPPQQEHIPSSPQAQPAPPSTRQSCSGIKECQAQAESQEVGKEEELQVFWFKEVTKDVDTAVEMDDDIQRRMKEDVSATKEINVAKPTVFDDEEVTMTTAQTLLKIKAKKTKNP
nr:hypothetical protein [Tanacetum cinerariifolium]